MQQDARIYVAGHTGLVGSALVRCLRNGGYSNLITRTHSELDLTDQAAVERFFDQARPEYVFLAAARVGGILANDTYRADFINDNLLIEANAVRAAWRTGVRRLLLLGSSCIYPRDCPQPIREEYLLTGPLELTNRPYAVAKIAGVELCWAYNRQHGTQYFAAMPTNLYGPADNYDLETSHVLPALIRKTHEAKMRGETAVVLWGTGTPRREFLYSDDVADACVFLMNVSDAEFRRVFTDERDRPPLINIGSGVDHTILELARIVSKVVGYQGSFEPNATKPDGTLRKLLDTGRLRRLGWSPKIDLQTGINLAYSDFVQRMGSEDAIAECAR